MKKIEFNYIVTTSGNNFQMGIYKLQTFIKNTCNNSIKLEQLKSLSGKRVAIDATSLMYKYKKENDLLYLSLIHI